MDEELKEREVFEAHMRVGGYSNHDKHPDGSYVSSAMELWWQGWKARAQLPSQGGEAVAWRVTGRDGLTVTAQYPEWAEADRLLTITPLYTHPADQVVDDLTMVKVSRELLYAITDPSIHGYDAVVTAIERLRALLNGGRS